jgi:hypothetical protein
MLNSFKFKVKFNFYSPVRQVLKTFKLACVKHTASVHPEPGSNSLKLICDGFLGVQHTCDVLCLIVHYCCQQYLHTAAFLYWWLFQFNVNLLRDLLAADILLP